MAEVQWDTRERCLCGASDYRCVAVVREGNGRTEIRRCRSCGVGFSSPYASEDSVHILYDKQSGDTNFEAIGSGIMDRLKDFSGLRDIRAIVPTAQRPAIHRVLDFGAGNGRFAMLCARAFPDAIVDALDYQPVAPPLPSGIRYVEFDRWQQEDTKYDLILLRHVLEHNHYPVRLLRALRDRLTNEGRLYIEVPNLDSWYVAKLGRRVNTFAVPFHLWHFNARSLLSVVESAGLGCQIGHSEMPLMGTSLAMLMRREKSVAFQLAGLILHPGQIALSAVFGAPCVTAICHR